MGEYQVGSQPATAFAIAALSSALNEQRAQEKSRHEAGFLHRANVLLVVEIRKLFQTGLLACLFWFLRRHGPREMANHNVIPNLLFGLLRRQVRLLHTR